MASSPASSTPLPIERCRRSTRLRRERCKTLGEAVGRRSTSRRGLSRTRRLPTTSTRVGALSSSGSANSSRASAPQNTAAGVSRPLCSGGGTHAGALTFAASRKPVTLPNQSGVECVLCSHTPERMTETKARTRRPKTRHRAGHSCAPKWRPPRAPNAVAESGAASGVQKWRWASRRSGGGSPGPGAYCARAL